MAKKNTNKVAVSANPFFSGNVPVGPQSATVKEAYVCPVSLEQYTAMGDLGIIVNGNTYRMPKKAVEAGKSFGWANPTEEIEVAEGVKAHIGAFGMWIKGSAKMDIPLESLSETLAVTVAGKDMEWKRVKAESGAVGWTMTGKSVPNAKLELDLGVDSPVQAVVNGYGVFLTKSKTAV